jgi:hypothetical protein
MLLVVVVVRSLRGLKRDEGLGVQLVERGVRGRLRGVPGSVKADDSSSIDEPRGSTSVSSSSSSRLSPPVSAMRSFSSESIASASMSELCERCLL